MYQYKNTRNYGVNVFARSSTYIRTNTYRQVTDVGLTSTCNHSSSCGSGSDSDLTQSGRALHRSKPSDDCGQHDHATTARPCQALRCQVD